MKSLFDGVKVCFTLIILLIADSVSASTYKCPTTFLPDPEGSHLFIASDAIVAGKPMRCPLTSGWSKDTCHTRSDQTGDPRKGITLLESSAPIYGWILCQYNYANQSPYIAIDIAVPPASEGNCTRVGSNEFDCTY